MVIIETEKQRQNSAENAEIEDDHDGWGPVRPRRSSMPAAMLAEPANENSEAMKDPSPDTSR